MKAKVLPSTNLESIEELVFSYLETNELTEYSNHEKVMNNMRLGMQNRKAIVLVDDINDPECFIWVQLVPRPTLLTEMNEVVYMCAWASDASQMDALLDAVERKAKMRGAKYIFTSIEGDGYPMSLVEPRGNEFQTVYMKEV